MSRSETISKGEPVDLEPVTVKGMFNEILSQKLSILERFRACGARAVPIAPGDAVRRNLVAEIRSLPKRVKHASPTTRADRRQ
ncbi:MAG TPA: hypothetical protein PKM58_07735 [Pyrinomonadaceae bacterium]|nr:hypothetical protein [Pyrinomonadaceae bacterium]